MQTKGAGHKATYRLCAAEDGASTEVEREGDEEELAAVVAVAVVVVVMEELDMVPWQGV